MARLVAHGFSISLDGYGAGPSQSLENPLGVGGEGLHDWLVHTRTFKRMHGGEGGDTGLRNESFFSAPHLKRDPLGEHTTFGSSASL